MTTLFIALVYFGAALVAFCAAGALCEMFLARRDRQQEDAW